MITDYPFFNLPVFGVDLTMPDARRLELFSRQARPGWAVWGDQADKFNEVDA